MEITEVRVEQLQKIREDDRDDPFGRVAGTGRSRVEKRCAVDAETEPHAVRDELALEHPIAEHVKTPLSPGPEGCRVPRQSDPLRHPIDIRHHRSPWLVDAVLSARAPSTATRLPHNHNGDKFSCRTV